MRGEGGPGVRSEGDGGPAVRGDAGGRGPSDNLALDFSCTPPALGISSSCFSIIVCATSITVALFPVVSVRAALPGDAGGAACVCGLGEAEGAACACDLGGVRGAACGLEGAGSAACGLGEACGLGDAGLGDTGPALTGDSGLGKCDCLGVVGFTGDSERVKGPVWCVDTSPGSARLPTILGPEAEGVGDDEPPGKRTGLAPIGALSAHSSFARDTLFPQGKAVGAGMGVGSTLGFELNIVAALRTGDPVR